MKFDWVWHTVTALVFAVAWLALALVVLVLPPTWGLAWLGGLIGAFVWLHVIRPGRAGSRRRLVLYRVVRPKSWKPLLLLAAPSVVLIGIGTSWLLGHVAGPEVFEDTSWTRIDEYSSSPIGWLAILLLVAVLAPLIEEFFFRGRMQRALERRFGAVPGVLSASALFAFVHLHPWPLALQAMIMGTVFGAAVWATQSIWAGVVLHCTWNGLGVFMGSFFPDVIPEPADISSRMMLMLGAAAILGIILFSHWVRTVHWLAADEAARMEHLYSGGK